MINLVKQAKTPMAFVNVKDLGFAIQKTDESGAFEYDEPLQTKGLRTIGIESGGELVSAYADGVIIESAKSDGESTVSLGMHSFPEEVREEIFNEKPDENGVYSEKAGKQNPYVAVWFKHERKDGSYKLIGLTKVMFNDPSMEGATKEASIEFGEETAEGTSLHRQADEVRKVTADSKHEDFSEDKFFQALLGKSLNEDDGGTGE
ncbi:major tail protein [Oceanobacillus jeddahense]|uniref:major tail protein n=1 Tax=Oceanobacillus jeddahense TaxID=1462527 RepID=UPI0036423F4C